MNGLPTWLNLQGVLFLIGLLLIVAAGTGASVSNNWFTVPPLKGRPAVWTGLIGVFLVGLILVRPDVLPSPSRSAEASAPVETCRISGNWTFEQTGGEKFSLVMQ